MAAEPALLPTPPLTEAEVAALAAELEPKSAADVLRWAAERFGDRIVLTCSWQRQSSVLVHLIATTLPGMRIVELDTGLLFPESYATRDALVAKYGVEVESITPRRSVEEQAAVFGPKLWERDPDKCCQMRKVAPLERALEGMDAWVTGIRREQSPTRANAMKVQLDAARGVVKVQPLVDWTRDEVDAFIRDNAIPFNPLHLQGYKSIGCIPCTRKVQDGEDERAGRWAGSSKTECGLHQ